MSSFNGAKGKQRFNFDFSFGAVGSIMEKTVPGGLMKRIWIIAAALCLLMAPALAQPLPEVSPRGEKQQTDYAYTADYVCDVWVFPKETAVAPWLLECIEAGFKMEKTRLEGYWVYRAEKDGRYAMLFPEYSGAVMLMVPRGMDYAFPKATPTPEVRVDTGDWHWETVAVEMDCPACVGGVCDLCDGTGAYRRYGVSVDCPTRCQTCDGVGTYTGTQTVKVYD